MTVYIECTIKTGVACLLNIPATCWSFSGRDLLRQVLPLWDRSCKSNFLPQPTTVYCHRANQSKHWHYTFSNRAWQGSHWSANFWVTCLTTYREAQTHTSQPESARQEQFSSKHLEESAWEPNTASLTPKWSQFCCTDVTWRTTQAMQQKIRHSSTLVWGTSTKSDGRRRSKVKICGNKKDRNQWPSRYCGRSGAGLDTPSGSQHPAPHIKPWPGTHRGRGREAGLTTVGGETLKQQGTNWTGITRAVQNRVRWRGVVDGLCSIGSEGHK